MRATRVIYVENDPALRGIMTQLLESRPDIDVILATGLVYEVLDDRIAKAADVALLDLALGSTQMNGIDLGLALRDLNDNIGIVIHSQYQLDTVARSVPADALIGWATLAKSGDMSIDEVVNVLRATARGVSRVASIAHEETTDPLEQMTVRQRAIMGMAAAGVGTPEIARRLNVTTDTVRQNLSRCYKLLLPHASSTDDLRTSAVLAYLELVRDDDLHDGT